MSPGAVGRENAESPEEFSFFLGRKAWIFKILDYIIDRVQIQIVHVSEISSLLGNQVLNFFFIKI